MKLDTKLLITFLLFSLIPLMAVSIFAVGFTQKTYVKHVTSDLQHFSRILENRINQMLDQNLESLSRITHEEKLQKKAAAHFKGKEKNDARDVQAALENFLHFEQNFHHIILVDTKGKVAASTYQGFLEQDFSNQEIFSKGLFRPAIGHLNLPRPNDFYFHMAGPLYHDSKLLGVLVVGLDMSWLLDLSREFIPRGTSGEILLARKDNSGNVVFINLAEVAPETHVEQKIPASRASSPVIQAFEEDSLILQDVTDFHGRKVLAVTQYLKRPQWALVMKIDMSEAQALPRYLSNILFFFLIIMVAILLFLSLLMARSISNPIVKLTQVAQDISRGDYDKKAEPKSSDEIGTLARSFNHMTKTLIADISKRKKTEQALKESEARYKAMFESMDGCVAVYEAVNDGKDFIFKDFNAAAERVEKISREDVIGKSVREVFPGVEEFGILEIFQEVWKTGNPRYYPVHFYRDSRIASWRKNYVYKLPTGEVVAIYEDVTDKKRAEENLENQLKQIRLLNTITKAIMERQDLDSISLVLLDYLLDNLFIDFSGVYIFDTLYENAVVTACKTKQKNAVPGVDMETNASISVHDMGLEDCIQGYPVYIADSREKEEPFLASLASARIHCLFATPLAVENKVLGMLVVGRKKRSGFTKDERTFFQSLSEQVSLSVHHARLYKSLQEAYDHLRDAQKSAVQQERLRALGQMASGIAHDIKNALSPIVGYTDLLLDEADCLSENARQYLKYIRTASGDVSNIISGMREFYRKREDVDILLPVDVNEVVRQVVELTKPRWKDIQLEQGRVAEVRVELDPDLPLVMGVESEIREALTNLIINAVDALEAEGVITITSLAKENEIVLEVKDNGSGMDEATQQQCLEPFFTTKGEEGTGLGLAMVYGTMQRHDGDMHLESEPGKGTTIRLIFPKREIVETGISYDALVEAVSPKHILCIDDEVSLRKLLADMLTRDGHQVDLAEGGQAGIEIFHKAMARGKPFDLVITDLGMPYVDGREVIKSVKSVSPSTPIILLTGWGDRMTEEGSVPDNVDLVMNKPPTLQTLREALAHVLSGDTGD